MAAVLGGTVWLLLRPMVATTFARPAFGLAYEDFNRLMLVPLGLLLVAAVGFVTASDRRLVRVGAGMVATALVLALAGVTVEFVLGGGLRGDRDLALAGWGLYLLGYVLQGIGLAVVAVGAARARVVVVAIVAAAMAAASLTWLPLLALRQVGIAAVTDAALGAGWIVLGLALSKRGESRPAGALASSRPDDRQHA